MTVRAMDDLQYVKAQCKQSLRALPLGVNADNGGGIRAGATIRNAIERLEAECVARRGSPGSLRLG